MSQAITRLRCIPLNRVKLLHSIFSERAALNRRFLMGLENHRLLQNYYLEAGLWGPLHTSKSIRESADQPAGDMHWGWEFPSCQLRGSFLGHWLSAAARVVAGTADPELKAKADTIVAELARCQQENGGEWAGAIPEKYLHWIARGKAVWAPHYGVHKTLMGLLDMHRHAGSSQALTILVKWANWFHRWSNGFSRRQMDDILDFETGGMMEVWADLYAITGAEAHRELMERYARSRLFDPLLAGKDPLTNRHANTTIPEIHGAARAYELTGDVRWRQIVEAYWQQAVTDRGMFCTGGQTCGEVWTPRQSFSARLSEKTQEHCGVYNMMRLAEFLFRWTGDCAYADYYERNLYNGILAQQNSRNGMVAYFLPLHTGGRKMWGTPTEDFWCCHGTLVQAHAAHQEPIYYEDDAGLVISQFIPSELKWRWQEAGVRITQRRDPLNGESGITSSVQNQKTQLDATGPDSRPRLWAITLDIECPQPSDFALRIRIPRWAGAQIRVGINGSAESINPQDGFVALHRRWSHDRVTLELPLRLSADTIPDAPNLVAFMEGPVVLAGLSAQRPTLQGDLCHPETILSGYDERQWGTWKLAYQTTASNPEIRFIPLYEVVDQTYTVYCHHVPDKVGED